MPYVDKAVNRAWDRRRNALDPRRRFSNSIGRYKRLVKNRIALKEQKLKDLQEFLSVQEK